MPKAASKRAIGGCDSVTAPAWLVEQGRDVGDSRERLRLRARLLLDGRVATGDGADR